MRQVVAPEYGDASVLTVQEMEEAAILPSEVRVDVHAAGVNFADIDQRRGNYKHWPDPPFVPGMESAGVVTEVGDEVDEWDVGDEVIAYLEEGGGYADSLVAPSEHVFPKPDSISFRQAATILIKIFTAHNTLYEWGGLSEGDRVLINAIGGGVGSLACQLAARDASTVIGTASTEEKQEFALSCGADYVIDYTEYNVTDEIAEITTDGRVDLLLDGVGGDAFDEGFEALRHGGDAVVYGFASGDLSVMATPRLLYSNKSVIGFHLREGFKHISDRVLAAEDDIFEAVSSGQVTVPDVTVFPLEDAAKAHERIENRQSVGCVVLDSSNK
jgi:NADPH2:quinone reductase